MIAFALSDGPPSHDLLIHQVGTATKPGPRLKSYYRCHPRPAVSTVREIIRQGKGKMPGFSTFSKSQMAISCGVQLDEGRDELAN